jgi:hypothetical protein
MCDDVPSFERELDPRYSRLVSWDDFWAAVSLRSDAPAGLDPIDPTGLKAANYSYSIRHL